MMKVKAGMRFINGGYDVEVVEPNPKIEGDWWCKPVHHNTGLWSYSERTILDNLIKRPRAKEGIPVVESKRERLAETARVEVAEHIRSQPGKWIDEIVASIEDQDAFIRGCITEYATNSLDVSAVIINAIDDYAEKAGESAYAAIISHPGTIV